jgi:hypothetical protein
MMDYKLGFECKKKVGTQATLPVEYREVHEYREFTKKSSCRERPDGAIKGQSSLLESLSYSPS